MGLHAHQKAPIWIIVDFLRIIFTAQMLFAANIVLVDETIDGLNMKLNNQIETLEIKDF